MFIYIYKTIQTARSIVLAYQLEELEQSRKALQVARVEYNVRRVGGAGGGACDGHGVRHFGGCSKRWLRLRWVGWLGLHRRVKRWKLVAC